MFQGNGFMYLHQIFKHQIIQAICANIHSPWFDEAKLHYPITFIGSTFICLDFIELMKCHLSIIFQLGLNLWKSLKCFQK